MKITELVGDYGGSVVKSDSKDLDGPTHRQINLPGPSLYTSKSTAEYGVPPKYTVCCIHIYNCWYLSLKQFYNLLILILGCLDLRLRGFVLAFAFLVSHQDLH